MRIKSELISPLPRFKEEEMGVFYCGEPVVVAAFPAPVKSELG
jgi:hypothetical protein